MSTSLASWLCCSSMRNCGLNGRGVSVQWLECKAVQALLKHPAFVEALHTLLKPYSRAVPALVMPIQELARKMNTAAGQLCFVQRCYTRLSFSDSRAVRAQSQSLVQVTFSTTGCSLQWIRDEGFTSFTTSNVDCNLRKPEDAICRNCLLCRHSSRYFGHYPAWVRGRSSTCLSVKQSTGSLPYDVLAHRYTSSKTRKAGCSVWRSRHRASRLRAWWHLP